MDLKNSCYTYFKITGDFCPDDITAILDLTPSKAWGIGELRSNGTQFNFALWEYGRCRNYDVYVENQMMRTIQDLLPKIQKLKDIKKQFSVNFTLQIVPSIFVGETNPCLAPSRAVIEFCYHTETEIDIDLYIFDSEDRCLNKT